MTKETPREPFSRSKLQDTDETAQKFYAFGLEGLPYWLIGQKLGCHANTVGTFLRHAPKSNATHKRGLEEAAAQGRMARGSGWQAQRAWRAARKPAEPKPDEMCPTCRQTVHRGEQAIMLTPSQIAEAQRQLDEIIDRHMAARDAAEGREEGG